MTSVHDEPREAPVSLGLLLASAAILLLEVGQVRVFSYILWHHVTYLVVTVTLLGFAAGGTCLAVIRPGRSLVRAGLGAALFGVLSLITFAVMARHEVVVLPDADVRFPAVKATVSYLYLIVPFFFGGLSIAAALDGAGAAVNRRYAVNMIGSAAGALLAMPVLRAFGGGGVVLVASALALVGAASLLYAARRPVGAGAAALLAVATFAMIGKADDLLPFPVAAGKTLDKEVNERGAPLIASYWDPICRVDVVGDEEKDVALRVYQDGDAPTWIPADLEESATALMANHLALGYLLKYKPPQSGGEGAVGTSRDRALVIGVGGGHDLKTALVMGAKRVLGAEINESTAAMMKGRFADYSGNLYNHDNVEVVVADGRSVVARSDETFDIIQITGADTYAALASGANLVAESYLYTIDAIHDYLDHLTDDGVLAILRWRFHPPRETLRLVGMAAQALLDRGVEDPTEHIAVINIDSKGDLFGKGQVSARYAMTLVKPTPFTVAERGILRRFCSQHMSGYYTVAYLPGDEGNEPEFQGYLTAVAEGDEAARAFEATYPYAIDPVTDDRPFFFQFFRGRDVVSAGAEDQGGKEHFYDVIGHGPAGLKVLWFSLAASIALVVLLVVTPLLAFRRDGLKVSGGGPPGGLLHRGRPRLPGGRDRDHAAAHPLPRSTRSRRWAWA